MFSEYIEQVHKWIREVTNKSPEDRNTGMITGKIMDRRFTKIYQSVELCRQFVEIGMRVIVRQFLKKYSTEPEINQDDRDSLFKHYGIKINDEKLLLGKIQVQTVWVPSRDKFCNVYDRHDCSPEELDEAAEYLEKMAAEIRERAQYVRMLAEYRRQNS